MKTKKIEYRLVIQRVPEPLNDQFHDRFHIENQEEMENMGLTADETIFVMSRLAEIRGTRERNGRDR